MAYGIARSGFTGPSANIGGSSPYHVDLKILDSLPLAEKVKAFDAIAKQYQGIGRDIEFSNQAISGSRYDLSKPFDDRAKLLMQAAGAHSPRSGWNSFDFYVPFKGKSRFEEGAVEGASIYLPAIPGGKVRRGTAGDYGYYSEALNPQGQVVFRVGHGDISRPETGDLDIPALEVQQPKAPKAETQTASAQSKSEQLDPKQYMKLALFQQILNQSRQPSISDQLMGQLFQGYLG